MVQIAMFTHVHIHPPLPPSPSPPVYFSYRTLKFETAAATIAKTRKTEAATHGAITPPASVCGSFNQAADGQLVPESDAKKTGKKRVFFLDVNPLCYAGSTPSLRSFGRWVSIFFSQVSLSDPVIAVLDGEGGSEHRRQLLPSYKAHRRKFVRPFPASQRFSRGHVGRSHGIITDVLGKCNVPVIKIKGHEADDVVATLAGQVLQKGYRVVIASPDKDFKQLISEDVQIVMPLDELDRWSFYTIKHYIAQYDCEPRCDLSLRCIVGDEVDGVPGIQHMAPGFGRKTALKLLKKHGSLENLLNAAAVRTVGKRYAQEALTKYADYLRRNYEVLALKRDVDIQLKEEWLVERETHNDLTILSNFFKLLEETQKLTHQTGSNFSDG
ncbi:5'-3' exonuclease [Carya illinoinensis]|nr:5'-3' exonuclease [Carya illinoinensis]XP_042966293.1 5'-3' exonuclease [Carya illinoinensis]XP_042966294.1 5'-3' exonuclease [Carya illinoinensis]